MANKIGSIPEFTSEDDTPSSPGGGLTLAEQADLAAKYGSEVSVSRPNETTEQEVVEEKEIPSELPAEPTPDEPEEEIVQDIGAQQKEEITRQVKGLQEEKRKLVLDLSELRGERKQTKQL